MVLLESFLNIIGKFHRHLQRVGNLRVGTATITFIFSSGLMIVKTLRFPCLPIYLSKQHYLLGGQYKSLVFRVHINRFFFTLLPQACLQEVLRWISWLPSSHRRLLHWMNFVNTVPMITFIFTSIDLTNLYWYDNCYNLFKQIQNSGIRKVFSSFVSQTATQLATICEKKISIYIFGNRS